MSLGVILGVPLFLLQDLKTSQCKHCIVTATLMDQTEVVISLPDDCLLPEYETTSPDMSCRSDQRIGSPAGLCLNNRTISNGKDYKEADDNISL